MGICPRNYYCHQDPFFPSRMDAPTCAPTMRIREVNPRNPGALDRSAYLHGGYPPAPARPDQDTRRASTCAGVLANSSAPACTFLRPAYLHDGYPPAPASEYWRTVLHTCLVPVLTKLLLANRLPCLLVNLCRECGWVFML